jgi:hypothetical protein
MMFWNTKNCNQDKGHHASLNAVHFDISDYQLEFSGQTGMVPRMAIRQMLAAARSQATQVLEKPQHRACSGRTRLKILYMPRRSSDDSCNT